MVLGMLATQAGTAASPASPGPSPQASPVPIQAARAELRELITDITAATAYHYRISDDQGRWMDTVKVIWVPQANRFAAVYHTWDEPAGPFRVRLATSTDLMHWTSEVALGSQASQPTIAAASDGGYVVAWEQEPDPIHIVIESFATWDDLLAAKPSRHLDVPVTTQACGEGTPSITAASSTRVDLGFHYHAACQSDREAQGSTDWTAWTATPRPDIDVALMAQGVQGHIGDRDTISFRGHDLMLIEGQMTMDDPSSWRTCLYDDETRTAEVLDFRSHVGSRAFMNPTIEQVPINGHDALLLTLYLPSEGARGAEHGPLLYYRTLPDGPQIRSARSPGKSGIRGPR